MDEFRQVKRLNNDSQLFEREFNKLKDFYIFDCEREVHDFIKINPGIILLLNEFEPSLREYFPEAYFELKFAFDMSGTWFDQLELNIWLDAEGFHDGSNGDIKRIRGQFLPLRRRLNLFNEVVISKRALR